MSEPHEVLVDLADVGVSDHAFSLFVSNFPRDAVRHEAQDLLNEIQQRSGRIDLDGVNLVQAAFADRQPMLEFNARATDREQNDHAALRHLLIGVVRGVRNVYSHDAREVVTREEAAIWLALMGMLRRQVEGSNKVVSDSEGAE
jgi:uncharacterized protein (TIGR02391 family)